MGTPCVLYSVSLPHSAHPRFPLLLQSKMFTHSQKGRRKMASNLHLNVSETVSYTGAPGCVEQNTFDPNRFAYRSPSCPRIRCRIISSFCSVIGDFRHLLELRFAIFPEEPNLRNVCEGSHHLERAHLPPSPVWRFPYRG
jgi:hypothetical protein